MGVCSLNVSRRNPACTFVLLACLFLPMVSPHQLRAQGQPDTLDVFIDPEDVRVSIEVLEEDWIKLHSGILVSRWKWTTKEGTSVALGGPFSVRTKLRVAAENGVILELSMSKDAYEPWGLGGRVPWKGPELVRGFLSGDLRGWSIVGGHFRVVQGYRLTSGQRAYSSISRTNPLAMPATSARTPAYSGTASGPVRFGVSVDREMGPFNFSFWLSQSKTTARLEKLIAVDGTESPLVTDVSSTSVFSSTSGLLRRRELQLAAKGLVIGLESTRYIGSILLESITTDTGPTFEAAPDALPHEATHVGWFHQLRFGKVRLSTESAFVEGRMTASRAAFRLAEAGNRPGILIDVYRRNAPQTNPFSMRPAFKTTADQESSFVVAMSWRPSRRSDSGRVQRSRRTPLITFGSQWRTYDYLEDVEERSDLRTFVSAIWKANATDYIRVTAKRSLEKTRNQNLLLRRSAHHLLMVDLVRQLGPWWRVNLAFQSGVDNDVRDSLEEVAVDRRHLVVLGLRQFRPTWSARIWQAIAIGSEASGVLYTGMPAVRGDFPLLAISAPGSRSVVQASWNGNDRTTIEFLIQRIWNTARHDSETRITGQITRTW